jgi:hypothetical protein
MKISIGDFATMDGVRTIEVAPAGTRRQQPNWYIWIKPDGSGKLFIISTGEKVDLPASSSRNVPEVDPKFVP